MNIKKFITEEKINILTGIAVFVVLNIYLATEYSFRELIGDIVYLNLIILIIYIIAFLVKFKRWKNRYLELYECVVKKEEITGEEIRPNYLPEEIMYYMADQNEQKLSQIMKVYEGRLRDVEEYISKWVHEIKLPISALTIILERIEDEEMSSSIKNETEKINFLVNSVMYGSRATAASENIFILEEKLDSIVKSAVKNHMFFLIKNNIEVSLENLNFLVYTDKKWLIYILDQIINNAIKYAKQNAKICFYAEKHKREIILYVKDNGIGIAPEDRERIFQKGFTGSNGRNTVYKSTGMGLYFSKKICEKLGHQFDVESEKEQYTMFQIHFNRISDYLNIAKM